MRTTTLPLNLDRRPSPFAAPDFDKLARIYRWMEWLTFGPSLQHCRFAFIYALAQSRQALVIGDGDGRFTARLLEANTAIEVDAIDVSPAMLHQLSKRSQIGRVRTHIADARTYTPVRRDYDLVATHFFLDCLTTREVEELASRLWSYTSPGAIWVVSEFTIPPGLCARLFARPLISALYFAFRLLTGLKIRSLPDHHAALEQSGWALMQHQKSIGGLLISELWQSIPVPDSRIISCP
ncbi:MAG: class I SAM-dependent methyltransferase [Acidobacteria bacterium]|nr:class I SAM-dependent methyltransferase [Acidobacteriota bacterium]